MGFLYYHYSMATSLELDINPEGLGLPIQLTNAIRFNINKISAKALNATMNGKRYIPGSTKRNVNQYMQNASTRFLDRPKKQTQNAWFLTEEANRNSLTAGLGFKNWPFDRTRFILPHITGVKRKQKKAEIKLINHPLSSGSISSTAQLVPVKQNFNVDRRVKIDRYGNVSAKTWEFIYNNVSTKRRQVLGDIKKGKDVDSPTFFIGKPRHSDRPPGVYWRRKDNHKLWMIFKAVEHTDYKQRYKAVDVLGSTVRLRWDKNFEGAYKDTVPDFLY